MLRDLYYDSTRSIRDVVNIYVYETVEVLYTCQQLRIYKNIEKII